MAASVIKTGGNILNRASGDVGSGDTSYVYFALRSHGYKNWSLRWQITGTTLTLEFTNQNLAAGLAPEAATAAQLNALSWEDQTTGRTGVASYTTNESYGQDDREPFYLGRVKLVTTNATNTAILDFNAQ